MRAGAIASVVVLSGVLACSGDRPSTSHATAVPSAVAASLGGDIVARVADVPIERSLVLSVARARKISAEEALTELVDGALLAKAAIERGAEREDEVKLRTASALSRALLAKLRKNAQISNATDEEIAAVMGDRWLELDHPELRRVVHALVKNDVPNARAVAEQLRTTLLTATAPNAAESKDAFMRAAKEFKVPSGPPVHVEELRIAEDSRVAEEGVSGAVQESFTKGTFAIREPLGTSEIVQTTYGFHVIRLLETTPPRNLPREEKIAKLQSELIALRVKPEHDQLVNQLRAATKIEIVATDALLALPR